MMDFNRFFDLLLGFSLILGYIHKPASTCRIKEITFNPGQHIKGCTAPSVILQVCSSDDIPTGSTSVQVCMPEYSEKSVNLDCFNGVREIRLRTAKSCSAVIYPDPYENILMDIRNGSIVGNLTSDAGFNIGTDLTYIISGDVQLPWQWTVYEYFQPIVVIAGLAGNTMSVVIMISKQMRQYPFSYYLVILAITDSLALIHFFMDWVDDISVGSSIFRARVSSWSACFIYPYIIRVIFLISAWLVVAFTVDRSISVSLPFAAHKYITHRHAKIILLIIFASVFLSQIYHPILLSNDTNYCGDVFSLPKSLAIGTLTANEMMIVFSRLFLLLVIPFVVILISNIAVIVSIKRRKSRVHVLQCKPEPTEKMPWLSRCSAETAMSVKLLSVSIAFFALLLPDTIVLATDLYDVLNGDIYFFLHGKSIRPIAKMIFTCNFAINFLLYSLAFRKQVSCFSRAKKRNKENSIQTAVSCMDNSNQ